MKNPSESYIEKKESTAIKGILIFLIVLGHNMIFTSYTEKIQGMSYLYCFHIQAFFILPFLYGSKPLSKKRIVNYFIRLYWPYLLLAVVVSVGYYNIYLQKDFDFKGIVRMCLTGDVNLIKKYCGIQIFWFLPAMFSLSILKDWFYYSNKVVRTVLLLISCIVNAYLLLALGWGHYYEISSDIRSVAPLGLYLGISYLVFGVCVRWLIGQIKNRNTDIGIYLLLFFVGCSIIYFLNVQIIHKQIILVLLQIVMPVVFMLILWYYRGCFQHIFYMEKVGNKTFPMYIIHPFIGYALYGVVVKYFGLSLMWVVITQIVMFVGSYYLSVGLYRMNRVRMFLLPQSFHDLKSVFK